jgi:hypothetical protein
MTHNTAPKSLTYDEKKAAEAAFSGRPFNEAWSESARAVYDGIIKALPPVTLPTMGESAAQDDLETEGKPVTEAEATESEDAEDTTTVPTIKDRAKAIEAGILIDVTPTAATRADVPRHRDETAMGCRNRHGERAA